MARTHHHCRGRGKFKGYGVENTSNRRMTLRKWKAQVRQADRNGRPDDAPVKKGTEGWETW